ncbi:ABC transporter permease [Hydrogenibacillus schlegelii]|uniref:ABC transporter permease n=1 Tax=Hydrogenibacillus schlegelii TaxID=1484 RepID=A0A132N6H9_HYDSH|nr:ABC transporter permease [Hydrogenibacillus schlegelii]KWX05616.1 tungstate transporter permease [Hydrogenibacillus schlegelii]MBT9282399.1 ABC transporter permease [Hydrogenibacillus schlegelii]OAR05513.1 tungstate transporter permease [Hydrogenibacillus schlegelii]
MDLIGIALREAWGLVRSGDAELWEIVALSLRLAGWTMGLTLLLGLPAGLFLGFGRFPGRRPLLFLAHVGMGLPPTVVGLWVALLFWRSGPLGELRWIYTPRAMVVAEVILTLPIVVALVATAIESRRAKLLPLLLSLGATPLQMLWLTLREIRLSLLTAVMAGFGRVFSEVGAAMMVGGNIKGETRTMTTAIVLEVSKGQFDRALALSFVLLGVSLAITLLLTAVQRAGGGEGEGGGGMG